MEISKIRRRLSAKTVGRDLFVYGEVGSTNDVLLGLFRRNEAGDGAVVISDSQTAGRGRLGRKWISPAGRNLYLSVLFRPDVPARGAPVFTFVGSLALERVFSGYGVDVSIKWPNDILADGKKVSGILAELICSDGKADRLVIGIGVNLNMSGEFMRREMGRVSRKVTSLSVLLGRDVDREEFAARLVDALDGYHSVLAASGAGAVTRLWTEKWGLLGEKISVDTGGGIIAGVAERVDEDGFLHVRTRGGAVEKIVAGDALF